MNAFEVFSNEGSVTRQHGQSTEGALVVQVKIAVVRVTLGLVFHGNDPLSRFINSVDSVNFYSSICRWNIPQQLLLGACSVTGRAHPSGKGSA